MLTLHLLGHNYLSQNGKPLKLSAKAVALLVYLTLQRRPQHREHLAELLWTTPDALRNLRVELTKLNQLGLNLFPARETLLSLRLPTDIEQWSSEALNLPEARLSEWLSVASSLPLSGLEDLGSAAFREWVDSQRWVINQQIEATLSKLYTRALQGGRTGAAALIRLHAELLGIELRAPGNTQTLPTHLGVQFKRSAVQQRLEEIAQRSQHSPQLVLFGGRSNSGKREVIEQTLGGGEWQLLQMQAFAQPDLQQATFLHQLMRVLPPDLQAAAWQLLNHPGEPGDDLVRTWTLAAASGQPLVIAIYDLEVLTPYLLSAVRFALDLPGHFTLILCASSPAGQRALQQALGVVDPARLHQLALPSLAVSEVMDALAERRKHLNTDQRLMYAVQVLQQSDGWDLHARELIQEDIQAFSGRPAPLLPGVRDRLLGQLGPLDVALKSALSRWSMVHAPLDSELATLLLGPEVTGVEATRLLRQATDLGLLMPAAPQETVWMPHLRYRHSDLDDQVCFRSEPLRVALASTLSSHERRELRKALSQYFLPGHPLLSLAYARRANLSELVGQLEHHLPPTSAAPRVSALPSLEVSRFSGGAAAGGGPAAVLAVRGAAVRREQRSGNGYRVATDDGQLQILRCGLFAPAPLLRLIWPAVPAGHWTMLARLDVSHTPLDLSAAVPYALGLRAGDGPRVTFSAQPSASYTDQGVAHQPGGQLPLGRWFRLGGQGAAGDLELSVRALDIALTIAEFRWGGQSLLSDNVE
ncbi:hypothetical protein [Deinococcus sp.]|uniref:hypothetical protein n=1 Tax=Deinococcus sp. TaxID=47478 RepID=UPI003B58ECF3